MTVKLGVLISGGGTTLQNFIDVIGAGKLDAEIKVVISSRANVEGVNRARRARIPTEVVERRRYDSIAEFSDAITEILDRCDIDLVVLAGLLQKYLFSERYEGRVLNIHPGPLPEFGGQGMYGHHVHEAVLAAGVSESACCVIIADHEYDHGPVILQKSVPVLPDDTPETLDARVFEAECEAYPEAVRLMALRLGLGAAVDA
ncbi:MAG TPA: phosphoribosylglycinamide formyltransferase [Dehalococcoidia bacterium]|nr:phosphoribosylglycinamide formyltransferase [Dehalococcoidia bacterium]